VVSGLRMEWRWCRDWGVSRGGVRTGEWGGVETRAGVWTGEEVWGWCADWRESGGSVGKQQALAGHICIIITILLFTK